jgi:D-methionine transport system substrate-binding protein
LEHIRDDLEAQGVLIEIVEFTEFVLVNPALHAGQIDANYFQHYPFLENYVRDSGQELVPIVDVHIEPMSIYSYTLTSLDQLSEGATVAIPNDAVNGGRALAVLESSGIIGLAVGVGIRAVPADIIYNPLNLSITELDPPLLPRALDQVDIAVINTNFALEVGLNPVNDSLYMESSDSPFANILVARPENANDEAIQILAATLTTEAVRAFILEHFEGAIVPAF